LAKLYNKNNMENKAIDMANKILEKEEKIPSEAVTEIKEEATTIKSKYESSSIYVKPKGKKQEVRVRKQEKTIFNISPKFGKEELYDTLKLINQKIYIYECFEIYKSY
jgi:hypothetical protein